jgi:hypothetical protein
MRCHCDTQPCTSSDFIAPILRLDFLAEVPFNRCIRAAAGVVGEILAHCWPLFTGLSLVNSSTNDQPAKNALVVVGFA